MSARQGTESTSSTAAGALQPAPYTSHYVQAGALKLHYLDYGTPGLPPMLCIHGGAANGHWFDFVAHGFTPDYHVRALDLRGHGDSEHAVPPSYFYGDYAADLNQLVEKLDLRDFVLIGHSMGGAVSLLYASTYPGRVKNLIIVDTSINLPPERVNLLRDVGSRPGSTYATREELVSRYRLRPGNPLATPDVVRHIAMHSGKRTDDGTWKHKFDRSVYATRESMDGMPQWERIKIPALLVKGSNSERITPEIYAQVKSRAPQAELVEVRDSDHHVTLDNPLGFVEKVAGFLRRNR